MIRSRWPEKRMSGAWPKWNSGEVAMDNRVTVSAVKAEPVADQIKVTLRRVLALNHFAFSPNATVNVSAG